MKAIRKIVRRNEKGLPFKEKLQGERRCYLNRKEDLAEERERTLKKPKRKMKKTVST